MAIIDKLGYNKEDITTLDVDSIYKKYGYNENDMKELKFEADFK